MGDNYSSSHWNFLSVALWLELSCCFSIHSSALQIRNVILMAKAWLYDRTTCQPSPLSLQHLDAGTGTTETGAGGAWVCNTAFPGAGGVGNTFLTSDRQLESRTLTFSPALWSQTLDRPGWGAAVRTEHIWTLQVRKFTDLSCLCRPLTRWSGKVCCVSLSEEGSSVVKVIPEIKVQVSYQKLHR